MKPIRMLPAIIEANSNESQSLKVDVVNKSQPKHNRAKSKPAKKAKKLHVIKITPEQREAQSIFYPAQSSTFAYQSVGNKKGIFKSLSSLTIFQKLLIASVLIFSMSQIFKTYNDQKLRNYLICQRLWQEWEPKSAIFEKYDPKMENLYKKLNSCTQKLYDSKLTVNGPIPEESALSGTILTVNIWNDCKLYLKSDPKYLCPNL